MRKTVLLASILAGCGGGGTVYDPHIDPANFTTSTTIDNPKFPLPPGMVLTYQVDETGEMTVSTVTSDTMEVMGVTTVVVHDLASISGTTTEDTYDWYAQDDDGNVWYFGEDTTAYDGQMVSHEGSWTGGVDGAQPGIIFEANPQVGDVYREEYLAGEAEDQGEVLSLDESVTVPAGTYDHTVMTKDFSEIEPDVVEHKYWADGIGVVYSEMITGGPEHERLVSVTLP